MGQVKSKLHHRRRGLQKKKSKTHTAAQRKEELRQSLQETVTNKQIDAMLSSEKQGNSIVKVLLLGAGESGKSTVFKQMQIIHNNGYTINQRKGYVNVIRRQSMENLRALVDGAERLQLLSQNTMQTAKTLLDQLETRGVETSHIDEITALWRSEELQEAFKQRCKFQLADSAEFFLDNVHRIMDVEYVPTYEDILVCRVRTTGVSEMEFATSDVKFKLVDVGGQRSERRKWIHCFDDVEAVLFVAAISEYDQTLFEDETTNRLHESLKLFEEICHTKCFAHTAIILFLNKRDLFEEKIATVDLNVCFPDFIGGCNYNQALELIKEKFLEKRSSKSQEIYIHVTTATDTGNMRFVFDSVNESIMLWNASHSGIL